MSAPLQASPALPVTNTQLKPSLDTAIANPLLALAPLPLVLSSSGLLETMPGFSCAKREPAPRVTQPPCSQGPFLVPSLCWGPHEVPPGSTWSYMAFELPKRPVWCLAPIVLHHPTMN